MFQEYTNEAIITWKLLLKELRVGFITPCCLLRQPIIIAKLVNFIRLLIS